MRPWINLFRRVDVENNLLAEGGAVGKFIVSRYYATGSPMPPPAPLPDFALGGTAREGVDYTATKQATTVVLPAIASGMVFVSGYEVVINTLADDIYENGGETVDFALIPNGESIYPVRGGYGNNETYVQYGIADKTAAPQTVISFTSPDPNASELTTSSGMYCILRNDVNLAQTLTFNYAFDETGLTDSATYYDDYTATSKVGGIYPSGSLTFPAGVAMIEVKLTPVDDSKLENDELAQLKLLSGSNYVVDAAKSKALIRIVDKELKPTGDLDIIDSNTAEVPESKEETPGCLVSANNDNDNYNFIGDQATSLIHELDMKENAKVVGENDLIKITDHSP